MNYKIKAVKSQFKTYATALAFLSVTTANIYAAALNEIPAQETQQAASELKTVIPKAAAKTDATQKEKTPTSKNNNQVTIKNYQRFTYVDKIDLDIGHVSEGQNWCADRLNLVFVTKQPLTYQDDKFLNQQIGSLLKSLKTSCTQLKEASLTGYSRNNQSEPVFFGSAIEIDSWKYSKLRLPEKIKTPANVITQNSATKQNQKAADKTAQPTDTPTSQSSQQQATAPQANRALNAAELAELQQRLNFLGFNAGQIDGTANRQTATAVSNFLQRNRINLPLQADLNVLNVIRQASGQGERSLQTLNPAYNIQNTQNARSGATQTQIPFNPQNYANTANPQQLNLQRRLSYLLVSLNNNLVSRADAVLNWMSVEARDPNSPIRARATGLLAAHKAGTQFEKQDIIKEARTIILNEANGRRNELIQPIRLVHYIDAAFKRDNFQRGKGFPFQITNHWVRRNRSIFTFNPQDPRKAKRASLTTNLTRLDVNLSVNINTPTSNGIVPIVDEKNARLFSSFLIDRNKSFRTRLFFDINIQAELAHRQSRNENIAGTVFEANERQYDLIMNDRNNVSGGDQFIYKWPLKQKPNTAEVFNSLKTNNLSKQGLSFEQFAQYAGISIRNGHLVYPDGGDTSSSLISFNPPGAQPVRHNNRERFTHGWARFKTLSSLTRNPNSINNPIIAARVANTFLNQSEKTQFVGGKDFDYKDVFTVRNNYGLPTRLSEFEKRAFLEKVRRSGVGNIYRRYVPALPLPVVRVFEVVAEEYNFSKQTFPLRYKNYNRYKTNQSAPRPSFNMAELSNFSVTTLPSTLVLPPDRAEFLSKKFRKPKYAGGTKFALDLIAKGRKPQITGVRIDRTLYFAIFADIIPTGSKSPKPEDQYRVVAKRASLYLDSALTQEVATYSLPALSQPIQKQTGPTAGTTYSINDLRTVITQPLTPHKVPVLAGLRIINDQSLLTQIVRKTGAFKQANELEQQQVGQALYNKLVSDIPPPAPYWASGTIKLGKYDVQKQEFAVASISNLDFDRTQSQDAYGREKGASDFPFPIGLITQIQNSAAIKAVPANEQIAKRVFQLTPNKERRTYRFKARITPTFAEVSERGNNSDSTTLKLLVHANDFFVYHQPNNKKNSPQIIAAMNLGNAQSIQANAQQATQTSTQPNAVPELTHSLIYRYGLGLYKKPIKDQEIDWLIVNHWTDDNSYPGASNTRFFKKDVPITLRTQVASGREAYRNLLKANQNGFPKKLRLPYRIGRNFIKSATNDNPSNKQNVNTARSISCTLPAYGQPVNRRQNRPSFAVYSNFYQLHIDSVKQAAGQNYTILKDVPLTYFPEAPIKCTNLERKLVLAPDTFSRPLPPVVQIVIDRLPIGIDEEIAQKNILGNFAYINVAVEKVEILEGRENSNKVQLPDIALKLKFESIEYQNLTITGDQQVSIRPTTTINRTDFEQPKNTKTTTISEYDIIGIKVGMPLADADKILKTYFKETEVLDTVVDLSPATPAFSQSRLYIRKDGSEFVKLFYEASDNNTIVRGVSRSVAAPTGAPFKAKDVLKAGKRKYGEDSHSELSQSRKKISWGNQSDNQWCRIDQLHSQTNTWINQSGKSEQLSYFTNTYKLSNNLRNSISRTPELKNNFYLFENQNRIAEFLRPYSACKTTVEIHWTKDWISTSLVDWPAYIKAYRATLDQVRAEINEEANDTSTDSNVKL